MYKKTAWAAGAALTVLAAASVAMAQQTSRKAAEAEATTIGELIVTAEKREQKLQDVPIAITAFTAKQRETTGIVSIQDITNFTPGLTYNSGLDRAAIRGVGRLTNRLSSDAAVATYSDGFYTTSVAEAGKSTLIVDRIEVLRGPQGTLYGRNAIGGAINVISKRPTNTKVGEARVTLGNYGLHNYELLVSGPVTDFARVQFYGQFVEQTEGYFRNVATGNRFKDALNRNYLEVQADVDVGERGHLWVKYAKPKWFNESGNSGGNLSNKEYSYNYSGVDSLTINPAFGLTLPNRTQVGTVTSNPQLKDPRTANTDFQTRIKNTGIHILTAQYTQEFDAFDVKYVGGYDSYRYDQYSDSDGLPILSFQVPLNASPAPSLNTCQYVPGCRPLTIDASGNRFSYVEDKSWFSHELNISSNQEGPFQWIAGLYYFKDTYHNPQISYSTQPGALTPSGANVGNPLGSALNPRGEFYFFDYDMTTESRAVFGQVDWKFRDVWQFTAGLRYTADHKEGFESFRGLCMTNSCIGDPRVFGTLVGGQALDITTLLAAGYPSQAAAKAEGVTTAPSQQSATKWVNYVIDPATGRANRQLENDWSGVTGTLGVEWNPDRGTNAYFRYGRGYKSGGFNAAEIVPSPSTDAETVDAYEIGLKKDIGSTLRINTAIFLYNYKDLQIPIRVLVQTELGNTVQTQFLNVPESESKGIEVEANWKPIRGLEFLASYSYNPTEVKSGCSLTDTKACVLDVSDPLAQDPDAQPAITVSTPTTTPNDTQTKVLQSLRGNSLPYAPESKFALNANYTWLLEDSSLTVSANYVWRDASYANLFTRDYNRAPAWDSKDFRVVWRTYSGRYTVTGYVRNAFDDLTFNSANGGTRLAPDPSNPTNYANVVQSLAMNPPRTYGIAFHYKFW